METISKSKIFFFVLIVIIIGLSKFLHVVLCNASNHYNRSELLHCTGNLVDKQQHFYAKEAIGSYYDSSRLMTQSGLCKLLDYTTERIVVCLDALRSQQPHNTKLHFLFMGDSRTRQQFLNFARVFPDYDQRFHPSNAPLLFQGDMEITSEILGLRVSFRWQPFVNDEVKMLAFRWANSVAAQRPSLVLLSMAVWHMFHVEYRDHRQYERKLTELAPVLAQLSNVTRVIWLNQYPTLEFYGYNNSTNTQIHSEKINKYNEAVRHIFFEKHNGTKVQIWDSGNLLVEEYVRSCAIFQRYEKRKVGATLLRLKFYSSPYRNCKDFTHTGYSALSQITQLLYNDICSASEM